MKKRILPLLALSLMGMPTFAQQPKLLEKVTRKSNEVVIPYEKYQLPNGLTVVLHEDHSDPLVHVDVTYHVGSAREEIGKSGFAHFFEHMMFQGSDNVADEQHFKIITEAGGTLNGTTNRDRTNYFETVPANQLEKMLWLEADRMGFLLDAVTQQKFEVQRATVKNERGERVDNVPYGLLSEYQSKTLYPYGHPYSWLTIGYVEDLDRVNVNDLKNFFLRWYGPNNATITIGGDIDKAQTLKWVQKYFGSIPRGPKVDKTVLPAVKIDKDRYVSYVDNYAKIPLVSIAWPTVPQYHKDMAALSCLANLLGQGKTSVLYQTMVKNQKALQAFANSSLSELAGEFSVLALPFPGKNLKEVEQLLRAGLDSFEKKGVSKDDVARFVAQMERSTINGLASVSGKVSQLAAFQTFTGNPNQIGKLLAAYQALTPADVMRVYNQYIKGKPAVITSVVPKGKETDIAAADNYTVSTAGYKQPDYGYAGLKYNKPKDDFDRSKMPAPGKNPVVNVPAYWTASLPNGIKAIGTQNAEIPTVTLNLSLKGGRLLESNQLDKAGWVAMVSAMMNEDTENYTAEKMQEALNALGSSINVSAGDEELVFTVSTLKKNLAPTLALLEERLYRPLFTEAAFKRLKNQTIENIKNSKTRPDAVADQVYDKVMYGKSLFGIPFSGTTASVNKITLDDVKAYYQQFISGKDGELIVVGDITKEEILPQLSMLNKLSNKAINMPEAPQAIVPTKTTIYLVDVPKAAQTEFRIGYPTGMKYDAYGDYYKAGLVNYVLAGNFNSRLNLKLREEKGWTYGASGGFNGSTLPGDYQFAASIKTAATDSALMEITQIMKEYGEKGITAEELNFMKQSTGQRDALRYETANQKAGFIGRILTYNLPGDFVKKQNEVMNNMSIAEMNALANKYFTNKNWNIVLVGDKQTILPGLSKMGYDIVELNTDGNPIAK